MDVQKIGNYTIDLRRVLGRGATGVVYQAVRRSDYAALAVKVIHYSSIKQQASKSLLQNEKAALKLVQCQNIIRLVEIVQQNDCCYIFTELHSGGTLKEYLLEHGKLCETEAVEIFGKLLAGADYLTKNCIIHRDLKPANILLRTPNDPVIIDLGFCEFIKVKQIIRSFNVGSPSYMAPEAYLRTLYSEKSDSWSLGVILFQLLHGKTLDEGCNIKQFFQRVCTNPIMVSSMIDPALSASTKRLIQGALKYSAQERISIASMKYELDSRKTREPILRKQSDQTKSFYFKNSSAIVPVRFSTAMHAGKQNQVCRRKDASSSSLNQTVGKAMVPSLKMSVMLPLAGSNLQYQSNPVQHAQHSQYYPGVLNNSNQQSRISFRGPYLPQQQINQSMCTNNGSQHNSRMMHPSFRKVTVRYL